MRTVLAIADITIKEMYRRKDAYVLFFMTALITLATGSVSFFHDDQIVNYIKDICLLLIWLSALIIGLTTAARQIPAEKESRTIFPLLAKPVSRMQLILGKFFGSWFAVGIALSVFYLFFGTVIGAKEHTLNLPAFIQGILLHWEMMAVVIAAALLGSILLSAPSATITIGMVASLCLIFVGGHLNTIALHQGQPVQDILYAAYFLLPHLEWFDLRDRLVYNWPLVAWTDCLLVSIYAAVYTALILILTWLRFRKQRLTT